MSERKNNAGEGGIGMTGLLQVAFIVLKLCGVIKWSWLWVLAPAWISIAIVLLAIIFILLFAGRD